MPTRITVLAVNYEQPKYSCIAQFSTAISAWYSTSFWIIDVIKFFVW